MEVILKKDVQKLGFKDDIVKVKPGYGRNFLIPQGYAILANESTKKMHEETLRQRSHKQEKIKTEAEDIAANLTKVKLVVGAKVGENGKIFGSVNNVQLADVLKKSGFNIDRKSISIKNEPIKEVGTYDASIVLHKDITVDVKFDVAEE